MAELHRKPARVSALASTLRAGRSGVLAHGAGVELRNIQPSAMAQIHGVSDADALRDALSTFELAQSPAPLQCVGDAGIRLLWNGPGGYLAVSDSAEPEVLIAALDSACRALELSCVDVSHAKCVLRVHGPSAQQVIAKGCALDLEIMRPRACTPTAIGRFDVLLHCVNGDSFELFVARSLAESFAQWLLHGAAEFGANVQA